MRSTNQLVILSRDLGEPLVKLQDCYYSYQIPEEEEDKCRREKVRVAMKSFFYLSHQYHLRLSDDFDGSF